jgi:hypothetical protein
MFSQNTLEVWKLVTSIATPVTIAVFGILINRTIQRQNALAQRQSTRLSKWADDFLKASASFDDSATSFIMLFFQTQVKDANKMPGTEDEQKRCHIDVLPPWLELNRRHWEMLKFADFAQASGKGLDETAAALIAEASSWSKNRGGEIQAFRQKQLAFNISARKVHAELLELQDSKR